MNSISKHDLHAGQLGRPRLHVGKGPLALPAWSFQKSLTIPPQQLVPLTVPLVTIPPSLDDTQHVSSNLKRDETERVEHIRQIETACTKDPNLAPAAELLPAMMQISTAAALAGDATFAGVLSIGRVYDLRGRKRVGIVAVASGSQGEQLRLNLLNSYPFTVTAAKPEQYVSWKIAPGRSGWWAHHGSRIRQIAFANTKLGYGEFLGVRFQASVALFKPEPQIDALQPVKNVLKPSERSMPVSSIDPGYFAEIRADALAGSTFAHFSFNSSSQEIAIVDTLGHWAIWQFYYEHKSNASHQRAPLITRRGWLSASLDHHSNYDGWARFLWSTDGSMCFAARRRNAVVHLATRAGRPLQTPRLVNRGQREHRDWIVDAKQCPVRPRSIWILTSHRLTSMSLVESQRSGHKETEPVVGIDLAQLHFRADEDMDLSLEVISFSETIVAIIRGKSGSPSYTHTFQASGAGQFRLTSGNSGIVAAQKGMCRWPRQEPVRSTYATGFAFVPVVIPAVVVKDGFPSSHSLRKRLVRFFSCSADLSISETTLSLQSSMRGRLPLEQGILRSRSTSVTSAKSVRDDFLVDDGMVSEDPDDLAPLGACQPKRRNRKRVRHARLIKVTWLTAYIRSHEMNEANKLRKTSGYSNHWDNGISLVEEALEAASRGRADLPFGISTFLEVFGEVSYEEFKAVARSFRGLLQSTFNPTDNNDNPDRPTTTTTSQMTTAGLARWLALLLDAGDATSLSEQLCAIVQRSPLPTINSEAHPPATKFARDLSVQGYLNSHKIRVAAAPNSLSAQDFIQEHRLVPTGVAHEPGRPDVNWPPASSPQPAPETGESFQGSLTSDSRPAVNGPHPLPVLASLAIIGAVGNCSTKANQLFDLWKDGEKANRHGFGSDTLTTSTTTPKARATSKRQTEPVAANKVQITDEPANVPSSPHSIPIPLSSSQLPFRSSQGLPASSMIPSSQSRATQATFPGTGKAGPSQSQRMKRRRAGF